MSRLDWFAAVGTVCVGALLWTWAPLAGAQTLNLGTPQAPTMGENAAALALAMQLRREGEGIDGSAFGVGVRREVRLLAAAMLEAGQREAESATRTTASRGSARILLARSLAARAPVVDALLERRLLDAATIEILAADLRRLGASADQELETLERGLREAFAPIAQVQDTLPAPAAGAQSAEPPPLGGWITTEAALEMPAYRAIVAALSADGTPLSSASVDALREVDALADRAAALRSFRRTADSIRAAVAGASALTRSATGPPRWLGPTARATIDPAFDRGLAVMADPGRRIQGLADLRRHARLVQLIERTDLLPDDQAGRRAREALSNYLAAPPTNRELEWQLLSAYELGLALVLAPSGLPDERLLARPLRPAWREFADAARVACGRLADSLPTLLNDSAAMTDPGMLALFNAANQGLEEARGLHALTALLTGQDQPPPGVEPVPLDRYRDLATRLLSMSQVASRAGGSTSGEGAAAKRDLGALAVDVGAWRVLPAELELRAAVATPDAAWTAATEGREHDLLDLVERTREAYLANVTSAGTLVERAALRSRMQLLAELLITVREVVMTQRMLDGPSSAAASEGAQTPTPAPSLNEWAGWELSKQAHRLLVEGLTDALSETVSLALRGEDERARLRIAAMRQDLAGALLPARLCLRWREVRPVLVGALDDVALGPPDAAAWMPAPREMVAEFCRVAEELPGIRVRRDDAQDRTVRAYLGVLAQDALAELR